MDPPTGPTTVTVATWNIYDGGTHTTGTSPWYTQDSDVITAQGVDVMMLNETNDPTPDPPVDRFTPLVAEMSWPFAHQFTYPANDYPLGLLTSHPVLSYQSWDQADLATMHKTIYEAAVSVGGRTLWVYGYHAKPFTDSASKAARIDEVNFLLGKMALRSGARIAAGDWNTAAPGEAGPDGGDVIQLWLDAGYQDAWRTLYPSIAADPGFTNGASQTNRIDYLMASPEITLDTAQVYSTWPAGATKFPSDHYLVRVGLTY